MMDGRRVTDFSIERILSTELGPRAPVSQPSPDTLLRASAGLCQDPQCMRSPVISAAAPGCCLQYRALSFMELHPYGAGVQPPGAYLHVLGQDPTAVQHLSGYHSYQHAGAAVQGQLQVRQKARIRTVFTESQTQRLEELFRITDYPGVEARAEVARSSGLSEETVRVWFKNRRARRKRQCSGSKVKAPSPQHSAGADSKFFTSFL